ncbi:MAG: MCE family protein [Rhodothermales bacterium]|nr:MCE family protein [Rhodothermales bacterium]
MKRQARVGIVVAVGFILIVLGLFAIGNQTFLFSDTMLVKSRFTRVAGLQEGAPVQYQGVNVGRVGDVQLPTAPGERIVVSMRIALRAQHLILENTQAQIKSDGLVGEQIIVLASSPEPADPVEEGGFLPGVDPFDLFEITDKALASVAGFERAASAFEQIMVDVQRGEGTLGKVVYDPTLYDELVATTNETRTILNSLSTSAEANAEILVDLAGRATDGIESIVAKVNEGDGTVARMLNDPAVYNSILATADSLNTIVADMRATSAVAENAATWGALGAFRFAELMEAAKHNWLFRRYFEERGSMEQAPFEIREQAISESFRRISERERELLAWEERLKALEEALTTQMSLSAVPADSTGGNQ